MPCLLHVNAQLQEVAASPHGKDNENIPATSPHPSLEAEHLTEETLCLTRWRLVPALLDAE